MFTTCAPYTPTNKFLTFNHGGPLACPVQGTWDSLAKFGSVGMGLELVWGYKDRGSRGPYLAEIIQFKMVEAAGV